MLEGESQTTEQVAGANSEGSPASPEIQTAQTSPATGAENGSKSVPFHQDPEFKSYLDRQRKSWDRDSSARHSAEVEKVKGEMESKIRDLEGKLNQNSGGMSDENRSQLRALANLIKSDPEAAKALGLDGIQELREKLSKYEQGSVMSTFNGELGEVSKSYADKYGYDAKEVEQDLLDYIKDDPLWSQMGMSKGVVRKAAKDYFSDKSEELAERAANKKLVDEANNKGKVKSQRPASGATQELPPPKSMREAINRAAKSAGVTI